MSNTTISNNHEYSQTVQELDVPLCQICGDPADESGFCFRHEEQVNEAAKKAIQFLLKSRLRLICHKLRGTNSFCLAVLPDDMGDTLWLGAELMNVAGREVFDYLISNVREELGVLYFPALAWPMSEVIH